MTDSPNISAVILAGGKSERMNYPKPFLLFHNAKTFLEKIVDEYVKFGCREIIIVLNYELLSEKWSEYIWQLTNRATIVPNTDPNSGRFYSVKLGLSKLKNCDFVFLQNVDNPFVDDGLLHKLLMNKNNNGYTVPCFQGSGGHPILLNNNLLNYIVNTKATNMNLKFFLQRFNKKVMNVSDEKILININTYMDYEKYFAKQKAECEL